MYQRILVAVDDSKMAQGILRAPARATTHRAHVRVWPSEFPEAGSEPVVVSSAQPGSERSVWGRTAISSMADHVIRTAPPPILQWAASRIEESSDGA